MSELFNAFISFSNNLLSLKIIGGIEIFHIFYFIVIVRGIHKIYNILGG